MRKKKEYSHKIETFGQWSGPKFTYSDLLRLLLLGALAAVFAVLYASLPRFLSQIYGSSAASTFRPTALILLVGFSSALVPAGPSLPAPSQLLGLTSIIWALFLAYGSVYFKYDVTLITSAFRTVDRLRGSSGRPTLQGSATEASSHWIPIVASSLVEFYLEAPLMASIVVLLLRSTRSKTHVQALLSTSLLFGFGVLSLSAVTASSVAKTSTLFVLILILNVITALATNSRRDMYLSVLCLVFSLWCLGSTTTYSCGKMPHLLQCRLEVGGFLVKASTESTTGRILVLENDKYRLLVADHSLLGGQWRGEGDGQSIFSTFYMQSLSVYAFQPPRTNLDVLQIGLGIGTSTKMMLDLFKSDTRHIQIEVVEIDLKVLEYAHDFFEVPRPSAEPRLRTNAVDALDFVKTLNNRSYDLILHDIFTGGSLAYPLFTRQFFQLLKLKLKHGGLLSVNYVYSPRLAQRSFESVTNTLRFVFSSVVVYVESGKLNEINNLVFLCSDGDIKLDIPDFEREALSNFGQTAKYMKDWQFPGLSSIPYDTSQILQDEDYDGGSSRTSIQHSDLLMSIQHWGFMRHLLPPPEDEIWISY